MVDIRLINILAQPGVAQSATISQGASSSPGISVNFPPGSILSGFILNRDINGNPVLRTDSGDITFQTDLFLKIGSEVVIKIEARSGTSQAQILSVNGQPPDVALKQSAFSGDPDVIVKTSARSEEAVRILPQRPPATPIAATPLTSPRGLAIPGVEPVIVRIASVTPPPPPPSTPAATPGAAAPIPPAVPYTAYGKPAITVTASPPQTTTSITPVATIPIIQPAAPTAQPQSPIPPVLQPTTTAATLPQNTPTVAPTAPIPSAATPPPTPPVFTPPQVGQIVTATVIGTAPGGEPIVQTTAGPLRLQGISLPTGTQVKLEVVAPPGSTPPPMGVVPPAVAPIIPTPLPELAREWTSLQQIASLLEAKPNVSLPWQPPSPTPATPGFNGRSLTAGLMVFVSALRGGNFNNWLGEDNVQWLKQSGHEPLVRKAEAEFVSMARVFNETAPAQQWQPLFVPVAIEGQLQQVRMYLKRDRKPPKPGESKGADGSRFIVELSLTQLGEMQMDGFVRRDQQQVEFDLFIRSLSPLETAIQQDIQRIYADIGAITGYRGSLVFQAVREFPVYPLQDIVAEHGETIA